jgi:hypothetical protein
MERMNTFQVYPTKGLTIAVGSDVPNTEVAWCNPKKEEIVMRTYIATVFCVSVLSVGCGSKELTRDKAKRIIESADWFKPQKRWVQLMPPEINTLTQRNLAVWQVSGIGTQSFLLTEAGKKYFEGLLGKTMQFRSLGSVVAVPPSVMLPQMFTAKVVEITGIAASGNDNEKMVEFKWQWETAEVPAEVIESAL